MIKERCELCRKSYGKLHLFLFGIRMICNNCYMKKTNNNTAPNNCNSCIIPEVENGYE